MFLNTPQTVCFKNIMIKNIAAGSPAAITLNGLVRLIFVNLFFHFFKLAVDILLCLLKQIVLILFYKVSQLAVVCDNKRAARHSEYGTQNKFFHCLILLKINMGE